MFCTLLQEVPEGTIESAGGPWEFVALLPLFDPPRHDSAETIKRALDLGVSVKMITGYFSKSNFSLNLCIVILLYLFSALLTFIF